METGARTLLSLQATQMETAAHSLMEQARALGEAVARDNDPHHGQTLSADRAYTVGEAALVDVPSWLTESDLSIGARRPQQFCCWPSPRLAG